MPTLILVRHGRSTANTAGVLAGWTPGVALDERGTAQAAALPARLARRAARRRRRQPAAALPGDDAAAARRPARPPPHIEDRIGECHYGDWSGRKLAELGDEPLMEVVQAHPSAAAFPGGESMRAMQTRAVEAVREWNARVESATTAPTPSI